jgi:hypothetical protein
MSRQATFYRYRRNRRRLARCTRDFRQRSCKIKVRFVSLEEALACRDRGGDPDLEAYACSFCAHFHLGHHSRRAERLIAMRREHLLLCLHEGLVRLLAARTALAKSRDLL